MSEEERIIEQAKFRATKLVKEYGVSLTFSGYDKVVAEIINSINWYKDFVKESDYSFARSQEIEFAEYVSIYYNEYEYFKMYGGWKHKEVGHQDGVYLPTSFLYDNFLAHQAKQKEGGNV